MEISELQLSSFVEKSELDLDDASQGNLDGGNNGTDGGRKLIGRWTKEEHQRFVEGLNKFGKNWKKVEEFVGTRTGAQIRSHAQKFFNRLQKESPGGGDGKSSLDSGAMIHGGLNDPSFYQVREMSDSDEDPVTTKNEKTNQNAENQKEEGSAPVQPAFHPSSAHPSGKETSDSKNSSQKTGKSTSIKAKDPSSELSTWPASSQSPKQARSPAPVHLRKTTGARNSGEAKRSKGGGNKPKSLSCKSLRETNSSIAAPDEEKTKGLITAKISSQVLPNLRESNNFKGIKVQVSLSQGAPMNGQTNQGFPLKTPDSFGFSSLNGYMSEDDILAIVQLVANALERVSNGEFSQSDVQGKQLFPGY